MFKVSSAGLNGEKSLNISTNGLSITSNKFYTINQVIRGELLVPEKGKIRCAARVAWVYPKNRSAISYKVGLEFLDMPEEDMHTFQTYLKKISRA